MKIYVASSWRNLAQPGVVAALRSLGHEVYDFRNPPHGKGGFGWSQIDPAWKEWSAANWRDALATPIAQAGYQSDRGGMDWADLCVLVLPSGRSAHLEAGFMAGEGKPVLTLSLEAVEPDLMNLLLGPPSAICSTMNELFDRIDELQKLPKRVSQLLAALELYETRLQACQDPELWHHLTDARDAARAAIAKAKGGAQ